MEMGARVVFKQRKFYINSYEAEYIRGELIYTYKLCREDGIWQDKIYNDKIKGVSLEGTVLDVSGEQVKLHLNIDKVQDKSTAAWFRYAPPTGNLMYSMPIVNTNANLYFPSERTEDPMVIGCVRKNGNTYEKFSNVNNRYYATESGNNLDMLPDAINFSRRNLNVNLNDGSGINLSSSSSLNVSAGYIGMSANTVTIGAKSKLIAKKGGSSISLEGDCYNKAGIVMENGSDRASNPNFTDDPQNGAAEAKEQIEKAAKAAANIAITAISTAIQASIGESKTCMETSKKESKRDNSLINKTWSGGQELKNMPDNVKAKGNAYEGKLKLDKNGLEASLKYDLYKDKREYEKATTQLKLMDFSVGTKTTVDFNEKPDFTAGVKSEIKGNVIHKQVDTKKYGNTTKASKIGAEVNWMSVEGEGSVSTADKHLGKGGIVSLANGSIYRKDYILGAEFEGKITGYFGAVGEVESFTGSIENRKISVSAGGADVVGGKVELSADFSNVVKVCSEAQQDFINYIKLEYYKTQYRGTKVSHIFEEEEEEIIDKYFGKSKIIEEDEDD